MSAAGHFEFGPQRIPIRIDAKQSSRIVDAWSRGDQYLGYAIQWAEVYRFVGAVRHRSPDIAKRLLVIRYEDFCDDPVATSKTILEHAGIEPSRAANMYKTLGRISKSTHSPDVDEITKAGLIAEVEPVAKLFGYDMEES